MNAQKFAQFLRVLNRFEQIYAQNGECSLEQETFLRVILITLQNQDNSFGI